MPFDYGKETDDSDDGQWPTDDLPAEFELDSEFKTAEEYLAEYDEG